MNLEALFNAVIVKPLEIEETKYGSIVVPDIGKDPAPENVILPSYLLMKSSDKSFRFLFLENLF